MPSHRLRWLFHAWPHQAKKSPGLETGAFCHSRSGEPDTGGQALLGSSSTCSGVGSGLGSFFRRLGSSGRSVGGVGGSASSGGISRGGVSSGSRFHGSGRGVFCGHCRRGFHGSSRCFDSGGRHGSSFFLLAASDEGSSSDHGSQNERVLHVSFPILRSIENSICHQRPALAAMERLAESQENHYDTASNYRDSFAIPDDS